MTRIKTIFGGVFWGAVILFSMSASAVQFKTSEAIYAENQLRSYQIRVIDKESGAKSALGSGFLVRDAHTVATNYHVISTVVAKPDAYRIKFVRDDGSEGELALTHIDIVNDLALLESEAPLGDAMPLATREPQKGARIFALGNPMDLGMTVVPGTYNGLADHAYYQRIHFSGSINSGMSGGPVLNGLGEVVGVNVATAGNQVSFLVPVEKLSSLLSYTPSETAENDFLEQAEAQLFASQASLLDDLMAEPWPLESLGEAKVLGEIPGLVSCWGRSNRDDKNDHPIVEVSRGCALQDSIYINRSMTTGSVEYEFYWIEGKDVAPAKFERHLQNNLGGYPGNRARARDVSEFKCEEGFTQLDGEPDRDAQVKSFLCARRYKQFDQLYDVFYLRLAQIKDHAFISHFTLAGVSQASANRFTQAFMEHVTWP